MAEGVLQALLGALLGMDNLYFALTALAALATVVAVEAPARTGRRWARSAGALRSPRARAILRAVVILLVTTTLVGLQNRMEPALRGLVSWDFTPLVHAVEGDAVERFQDAARSAWLDVPLVLVYTVGAFLLYHVPFLVLVLLGRGRAALRLAVTLAWIWGVGLVFYVLVPVREVWMTSGAPYFYGQVENVLLLTDPSFRESQAYLNALDNNFPSLHVAVAMGILFALAFARERWLAWASAPVALGIALATVYLGIHWLVDVAAGLLLAFSAAWLVHRRLPPEETPWRGGGPPEAPREAS